LELFSDSEAVENLDRLK